MNKLIWTCIVAPSFLFSWFVNPGRVIINPEAGSSIFTVVSMNDDEPMPIDIYTATRDIDINGNETFEKIKGKFIVIPSQFMLQPNERKLVRVVWRGDKKMPSELSYRLVIQGVPISGPKHLNDEGIAAQIAHKKRFVCPLYVRPKKTFAKLEVLSSKKIADNNEDFLELRVKNNGSSHKYLKKFNLEFYTKNNKKISRELTSEDIRGSNLVLSNRERIFKIKWSDKFPKNFTKVKGSF